MTDLDNDELKRIVLNRGRDLLPERLALSRETFLSLNPDFLLNGPITKIYGIPLEFDERVPLNKFRPIYGRSPSGRCK